MVSGCSDDEPEQAAPAAAAVASAKPAYDGRLEPSAAVLALVPGGRETLTVTDFDQVRLELGLPELERPVDGRGGGDLLGSALRPSGRC